MGTSDGYESPAERRRIKVTVTNVALNPCEQNAAHEVEQRAWKTNKLEL